MASRKNTNVNRAARRGKKNAARRSKGRPTHRPGPAVATTREDSFPQGFRCAICGVQSRPSDDEWSAYSIPNLTSEVRFVCPSHAPAATVESVFRDLFPDGLEVAKCVRCGRLRMPKDQGWSVHLDAQGRVVQNLCPMDQTAEEKMEMSGNTATLEQLLADTVMTGRRDHELHLLSRAEFACRSVFEQHVKVFLNVNLSPTEQLVTRHDLVDWAAEAVERLAPPEDLRTDFLAAFFEQYVMWLAEGLDVSG